MLVLGAFSTGVFNTNKLPRINMGSNVWGESSIMTGVYQRWCLYGLGGGFFHVREFSGRVRAHGN
jgi:hypothetical protein